eukprot:CAMPEP_0119087372 /NCGR_PEP_ID=MMETSP1178-20130426/141481_1 /TAXON_ID=33656 /ORGANISM="unid sp, Strain CCMP2000" /LENGTH=56 /DNA_ID=CAMNT_0007070581 /DNA_START=62 /DNA_END=232 /DNA_ORIENTATION=+
MSLRYLRATSSTSCGESYSFSSFEVSLSEVLAVVQCVAGISAGLQPSSPRMCRMSS